MSTVDIWSWACEVHGLSPYWNRKPGPEDKPVECNVKFSTAHISGDGRWLPLPREDEPCRFGNEPVHVMTKVFA